jgi:hypothetical protein
MESFNILPYSTENPLSQFSGWGQPRTVDDEFRLSEPMDIAFQLLKEDPLYLQPSNTLARRARKELETDKMGENSPAYQEMMERMMEMYEPQDETIPLEENLDQYAQETGKNPWRMLPGREMPNKYGGTAKVHLDPLTPIHPQQFYDWQAKNASEPMDIALRLLKYDDEIPDYSDYPVYQCEVCDKYLDESSYYLLNDHHYCKDHYFELLDGQEFDPDFQSKLTGEPMDIAMRLLKRDEIYDPNAENKGQEGVDWHPGEEGVDWDSAVSSSLHPSHDLTQRHPFDYDMHEYDHHAQKLLNLMRNRDVAHLQNNENPMTEDEQFDLMDARQKLQASIPKNTHFPSIQNAVGYDKDGNKISTFGDGRPKFNEGSPRYQELIGERPTVPIHTEGSFYGVPFNEETGFTRSEPMDIAFQLLKERVSPEAKRHKLEYDKKYESTPERVKYREDLNRERRRRGIYGSHDHKDISHTEGGKLTLEGEHENRARHFKDKGTLREL